jgi:SAM-dependent methyltransferase
VPERDWSEKRDAWRDPRVAAEYEARRFRRPAQRLKHRHDVALLLRLLRGAGGVRTVLDLPMGTGRLLAPVRAAGYEVVGADVSLEMMERAAAAPGAPVPRRVQADGAHLPFLDASFDAVVCVRFLFHVRDPAARVALLREMGRVCRVAVVGQVRHRANAKHVLRWARHRVGLPARFRPAPGRDAIARELAAAGLSLERLVPVSRVFSDKALFVAQPVR